MRVLVLLMGVMLLNGCIVAPTPEGRMVRMVDNQSEYNCKFVTTVTGSGSAGWTTAHDAEGAMNEIMNKAAKAGANAVRVVNIDSNIDTTVVVGEALNCQFDY
ncbi:DUF4156 domain-containing protein [Aliivibrio fischeri]|uniref:DUF4156 domain-containing protein n=1 Tax=Aliivibrio fischeri TaxID=668 RepID=UPI00037D0D96|nr:DUF4156 domain-containing protein [Aliivibrio fischeri]OCH29476.1 hypothetical protein A6E13_19660 [Aliivibrio fischeri]OED52252.1 hypothetical protein BEI47_19270 [Aliivibrio fischeri]OEE11669.1 hypothetical protein A1Q3_18460 [Aliivibrio fischeri ZF-211]